jgi:flavin-dependent dehydrogenase
MVNFDTDVLIVGGGPAGAAAAISLLNYNNDISVTVIEQSDLANRRVGEHVSAGIFGLLNYLNLGQADFGQDCFVPTYGNTSYWGTDQPILRDSIFTTEAASFQLDREQFDLTLLKIVSERGGNVFPRAKCTQFIQLAEGPWQISLRHPVSGTFVITAKFLIDASGRQAYVCRQIGVSTRKEDQLMGVGAFLQFDKGRVLQQDVLLETVENGWWYSAALSPDSMTIVFFSDADIISKNEFHKVDVWYKLLQETRQMKQFVKGSYADEPMWVRSAHSQISNAADRVNFLAIGDAAASFDPISSMGIGFAITSACHAAAIVKSELTTHDPKRIAAYQIDVERNFENYHTLRRKIYQQERRWPLSDFWMRRNGGKEAVIR